MNIPFILILLWTSFHVSGTIDPLEAATDAQEVCFSQNEIELGKLINAYRHTNKLNPIPLSAALTKVAQAHVRDRALNFAFDKTDRCNMHSWSGEGNWKECCYSGGSNGPCMWDKPAEIAGYTGDGYEIIMVSIGSEDSSVDVTATEALTAWKGSTRHNDVVLNKEIWQRMEWQAMGIGMYQGYAAVWFGVEKDPSAIPTKCP